MGSEFADNNEDSPNSNVSTVSWTEMFHSASKLSNHTRAPGLYHSLSAPSLNYNPPAGSGRDVDTTSSKVTEENMEELKLEEKTDPEVKMKTEENTEEKMDPEVKMKTEENIEEKMDPELKMKELSANGDRDGGPGNTLHQIQPLVPRDADFQLALYIAMAHAGLALLVVVLYGLGMLLSDFGEPIQWAVLCSMPLREVQETLVAFWKQPLEEGLLASVFAVPIALYKVLLGTIMDARDAFLRLIGKGHKLGRARQVGFAKLFQWLVAFALFTLGLDVLGPAYLSVFAFVCVLMYAAGTGFQVKHLTTALSHGRLHRDEGKLTWVNWAMEPIFRASRSANQRISRKLMNSLHTLVALGLITMMILGSLGGLVLFSYKIGMEGKDAVVMIKVHLDENDYAEVVGYNKWVEDNKVPELIDTYVVKGYDALLEQVDSFAAKNNLTEFVDVGKELLMGFMSGENITDEENITESKEENPILMKLRVLQSEVREFNIQGIMTEMEATFLVFLERFQMKKEDFIEKAQHLAHRSTDVGKRVLTSGTTMVTSGASMFFFISRVIASGAAELVNFVSQSLIFFAVLYYLITSDSGGVMEQILGMVPLSEPTRRDCASVLNHAVSSVLLATVKTAFFQASFTWLLFRFCEIHFLYGSTLLALVQAFLPLFPNWLVSVPLAVEFALNKQYIAAVGLFLFHVWVMDYGMEKIHEEIPGHDAYSHYLTGLSIAGGVALFTPALEGAIMGPLIMTVLIAVKNLYARFVLKEEKALPAGKL